MEKINIAELLKDCPKGMELDCTMYEGLEFDYINAEGICTPICCRLKGSDGRYRTYNFTKYGCWSDLEYAKCVIFPKGKTTWEGFAPPCQFKDGDVIVDKYGAVAIYKRVHSSYEEPYVDFHCGITSEYRSFFVKDSDSLQHCGKIDSIRLATEEEKAKLFQAIKDNGYRWNTKTKTLEKLVGPKFKVGDIIHDVDYYKVQITEINEEEELYIYCSVIAKGIGAIPFEEQDNWKLVPNKFDINTLKPFESRVLVRHNKDNKWCGSFFSFIDRDHHSYCYKFVTTAGKSYPMMIPYKGNEWLLGKTDDCDEYYKNW